jgi:hypothetical protein
MGIEARASGWKSSDAVKFYVRNDHMGLTIPREYLAIDHA